MDWKKIREISYLFNEFDDIDLPFVYIDMDKNVLIDTIVNFFKTESDLIYPAKSYFVAIIYAKAIEKYFHKNFYLTLDDNRLLPDDFYFKTYTESKEIYDSVLDKIDNVWQYPSINATLKYFYQEFLIGTNNQTYVGM